MSSKYLTTTQASKICGVTRFTIANWVKSGMLKSSVTAGGHRRIFEKDFLKFVSKKNLPNNINRLSTINVPNCWEFRFQNQDEHDCVQCVVFKEGASKCFLLAKNFGSEKRQCSNNCIDCEYLIKFYPSKQEVMNRSKSPRVNYLKSFTDVNTKDASDVVKKGIYASGRYIASIKRVLTKKKDAGAMNAV